MSLVIFLRIEQFDVQTYELVTGNNNDTVAVLLGLHGYKLNLIIKLNFC